jgi:hypothetical protein
MPLTMMAYAKQAILYVTLTISIIAAGFASQMQFDNPFTRARTSSAVVHKASDVGRYDRFQDRSFAYDNTSNYDVEWTGKFAGHSLENAEWALQTGELALLKVTRRSQAPIMADCDGDISDSLHVLLDGPATLGPLNLSASGNQFAATITAYDVGMYRVHIEVIFRCSRPGASPANTIKTITERPAVLHVAKGPGAGFPRQLCRDYRWRHGRWMECSHTPLPCVRTRWIWVPDSCHYQVILPDQMINGDPMWIAFAGSSVERGSFLSLVDYVLGDRAKNLTSSDFWKCWGWSKWPVLVRFARAVRGIVARTHSASPMSC